MRWVEQINKSKEIEDFPYAPAKGQASYKHTGRNKRTNPDGQREVKSATNKSDDCG